MDGIKAKSLFDFLKHLSEDELNSLTIRFKRNIGENKAEYFLATEVHFVYRDSSFFYNGENHLNVEKEVVLTLIS